MTDMLDLITLFAGIGIGWLMGRTLAKPQRGHSAQNAAGTRHAAPRSHETPQHGHEVGSDDSDPAERRTGPEGWCWHPETETTLCGLTTCWTCGTEWTEARP